MFEMSGWTKKEAGLRRIQEKKVSVNRKPALQRTIGEAIMQIPLFQIWLVLSQWPCCCRHRFLGAAWFTAWTAMGQLGVCHLMPCQIWEEPQFDATLLRSAEPDAQQNKDLFYFFKEMSLCFFFFFWPLEVNFHKRVTNILQNIFYFPQKK